MQLKERFSQIGFSNWNHLKFWVWILKLWGSRANNYLPLLIWPMSASLWFATSYKENDHNTQRHAVDKSSFILPTSVCVHTHLMVIIADKNLLGNCKDPTLTKKHKILKLIRHFMLPDFVYFCQVHRILAKKLLYRNFYGLCSCY